MVHDEPCPPGVSAQAVSRSTGYDWEYTARVGVFCLETRKGAPFDVQLTHREHTQHREAKEPSLDPPCEVGQTVREKAESGIHLGFRSC